MRRRALGPCPPSLRRGPSPAPDLSRDLRAPARTPPRCSPPSHERTHSDRQVRTPDGYLLQLGRLPRREARGVVFFQARRGHSVERLLCGGGLFGPLLA